MYSAALHECSPKQTIQRMRESHIRARHCCIVPTDHVSRDAFCNASVIGISVICILRYVLLFSLSFLYNLSSITIKQGTEKV